MFPNSNHLPSGFPKTSGLSPVAFLVFCELRHPIIPIRFRKCRVSWAPVPKASIHEHSYPRARENDIHRNALDTPMESEAKPLGMKS